MLYSRGGVEALEDDKHDAADKECKEHHNLVAEKIGLHDLVERETDDAGGDKGHDQLLDEFEIKYGSPIEDDHGEDGTKLYRNFKALGKVTLYDAEERGDENQMPGRGDGEEFGCALDDTQYEALKYVHEPMVA